MRTPLPQTRFVAVGDADVAYQVVGKGPPDLLLLNGAASHVELNWQLPDYADVFRRFASFSRLIMFDRRGTGASSPASVNATWEEFVEDAQAVLGAVGSETAAILGVTDTVPIAILFAAIHPDRVASLTLLNGTARSLESDDYPIGLSSEEFAEINELIIGVWGTTELVRLANPSRAENEDFLERGAAINRGSATPQAIVRLQQQFANLDVRHALPLINAPTLVLHAKEFQFIPVEMGRYVAEHIEGAKFVELPGGDFGLAGESGAAVPDEVAEFLTGQRPIDVERILATVLFTDIADSTAKAAALGDRRWRSLLDAHDQTVREQLRRFRGREINTTGDGFVVSFNGPAQAIRCARATIEATTRLGINLRAGIHTGECEVRGDDLGGLAVHIAARVAALASPREVRVSGTVKDLVMGSGIEFEDRGEHDLKGVPGPWRLFVVRE